jgi:hypothetical protein
VDRRTAFFLVAAALCGLLLPEADEYAWVAGMLAVIYLLLAGASWLEDGPRRRS